MGDPIAEDLSDEIAETIERRAGDQVRCTHISGHTYRCNWWAMESVDSYDNPSMSGLMVTTHRVRMSRFLQVIKRADRLIIKDVSRGHDRGGE